MKTEGNFDFYCPLLPEEVLNRLKQSDLRKPFGEFYGEVKSNIFIMHYRLDPRDDENHPLVSGYVIPEEAGSRVFVKIKGAHVREMYAKFGGTLLFFLFLSWTYIWRDEGGFFNVNIEPRFLLVLMRFLILLLIVIILIVPIRRRWNYLRNFGQRDMTRSLHALKALLDVGEDNMTSITPEGKTETYFS